MQLIDWIALDPAARRQSLARPESTVDPRKRAEVERLVAQVRADGDTTLRALTRRFDGCELDALMVTPMEFDAAEQALTPALKTAIGNAHARILRFHQATAPPAVAVQTAPGVVCERLPVPIARCGLYVPAGSAPLPSTALMLGVPAQLARVPDIVLCSPPRADGTLDPAVLFAARLCGIHKVFKLGGVQAIAAMAFGTETVPCCDKLFGPGNSWVTLAKQVVAADPEGPGIDLPAGPSEVLVVAEAGANPVFLAADLLAQAEHGPDSQVLLVSPDGDLLESTRAEVHRQLVRLPRAAVAAAALAHSRLILCADVAQALSISDAYAPEHLILHLAEPRRWLPRIRHAGSVFLGALTPESLGDYCSGTNHVLPTGGHARALSGVSVASFVKLVTVQSATAEGLRAIGPDAVILAEAEGLEAHANAVRVRLEALEA